MWLVDRIRRSAWGRQLESAVRFHGLRLVAVGETNARFCVPGWQTLDLLDADYVCDIRKGPLPLENDSVDMLYCSHVVEHLPEPDASMHFFREARRVLKDGGLFRICTPDAALLIKKYLEGDWLFFLQADGRFIFERVLNGRLPPECLLLHNRLVGWFASYSGRLDTGGGAIVAADLVDRQVRNLSHREFGEWCVSLLEPGRLYAHVNLYDHERLALELRDAGFGEVFRRDHNESGSALISRFHMDREKHRPYSLYVEAVGRRGER